MNEYKLTKENARQIKERYEDALLKERYDIVEEIENLYKNTPFWRELERIKKEIDGIFMG